MHETSVFRCRVLMSAPDLKNVLGARNTFGEFITTRGGAAFEAAISRALASIHWRFCSPWVATLVCGVLACLVNENLLVVNDGAGLILVYGSLCVAVMIGRWRGTTAHGYHRMPSFPLAPIASLVGPVCSPHLDHAYLGRLLHAGAAPARRLGVAWAGRIVGQPRKAPL